MVDKKRSNLSKKQKHKKEIEKVYYSEDITTCFACGEKIDINSEKCPYCGTALKKHKVSDDK
ncbi:MAG: zinc-ribbon domain-containing protein [Candidatus Lokiarchaeota archaeon]